MKKIYLDYAAATPLNSRVRLTISRYLDIFGNASSAHLVGRRAREVIENSRKKIAGILGLKPEEVVFTSSGTEANNLAVFGVAKACRKLGGHIITSEIEHHSVLRPCQQLEKEGFKVTYLKVGSNGIVSPTDLKKSLRHDTILVSVMYANNEIGTIQPVAEIANIVRNFRNSKRNNFSKIPFFHSDVCQAAGFLNLNVRQLGLDLATLNGSKIYGPKGVGCLFVGRNVLIQPEIVGGDQERGLRAGTENPALIIGLAEALTITEKNKKKEKRRLTQLRDYLISKILEKIPNSHVLGDTQKRLANNVNIAFNGADGEMLMLALDQEGIQVSTGSACTVTSLEPSHVIKALGLPDSLVRGNLRITLGRGTTKNELDYFLKKLVEIVARATALKNEE